MVYCSLRAPGVSRCITIRYDTRCYFNVRSKADISQLNLPHCCLSSMSRGRINRWPTFWSSMTSSPGRVVVGSVTRHSGISGGVVFDVKGRDTTPTMTSRRRWWWWRRWWYKVGSIRRFENSHLFFPHQRSLSPRVFNTCCFLGSSKGSCHVTNNDTT